MHAHTHTQTANHSLVQVLRHWDYWWLSLPGGLEAGIWQTQIKGCLELPAASNSISRLPSSLLPPPLLPTTTSPFFISPSFGLLCCHGYAQLEPSRSGGTCQGVALRSPDAGCLHRWPVSHAAIVQFWLWLSLCSVVRPLRSGVSLIHGRTSSLFNYADLVFWTAVSEQQKPPHKSLPSSLHVCEETLVKAAWFECRVGWNYLLRVMLRGWVCGWMEIVAGRIQDWFETHLKLNSPVNILRETHYLLFWMLCFS